jgi:hypothetical protein
LDVDAAAGVLLLEFLPGTLAHRLEFPWSLTEASLVSFLQAVALSSPPLRAPSAKELLGGALLAAASRLAQLDRFPRWQAALASVPDVWSRLDGRPQVACHGDLWAGNVMVDVSGPSPRVAVFDPAVCSSGIEFDVARVAADGWNGPGAAVRAELLCRSTGADRSLVADLMVVLATAQVATFVHHGWDLSPVAAGLADVAATCGVSVEPLV